MSKTGALALGADAGSGSGFGAGTSSAASTCGTTSSCGAGATASASPPVKRPIIVRKSCLSPAVGPGSTSARVSAVSSSMPRSASPVRIRISVISALSGTPSSRTSPIRSSARCAKPSTCANPSTRELPLKVWTARNSAPICAPMSPLPPSRASSAASIASRDCAPSSAYSIQISSISSIMVSPAQWVALWPSGPDQRPHHARQLVSGLFL